MINIIFYHNFITKQLYTRFKKSEKKIAIYE